MTSIEPTGERVVRPSGFDLAEAWKLITDEVDQRRAPLRATRSRRLDVVWDLRHMFGTRVRIGPTTPDGRVEVELRGQNAWLLAAEIAGFGSVVEVLDPAEVRDAARTPRDRAECYLRNGGRESYDRRMTPDTDVDPDEEARLAGVAYMEDDLRASRRHAEAAFRAYRDRGDLRSAARVAMTLAVLHDGALGNHAAGRGWLDRARRTLDRVGPCVEWGYLELAFMACDRPDIDELEASADRALTIALEFGDHDLEVCALADSGVALITQGRLREGLDRLDGAMAAISAGELADYSLAGRCFCSMLTGCDRAGDVNRVEEWMHVMRETMLEPNGGRPKVLATHCLVVYGSLLAATGRWTEAEEVMTESLAPTASRSFGHRVETTMNLGGIRIEQGRIEDAQALIAPYEDHVLACEPIARVRLVAGDPGLASAAARRGLKEMKGDAVRGAALLARLVEAEIALGDLGAAADAADGLADLAARTEVDALAGEAELARGPGRRGRRRPRRCDGALRACP